MCAHDVRQWFRWHKKQEGRNVPNKAYSSAEGPIRTKKLQTFLRVLWIQMDLFDCVKGQLAGAHGDQLNQENHQLGRLAVLGGKRKWSGRKTFEVKNRLKQQGHSHARPVASRQPHAFISRPRYSYRTQMLPARTHACIIPMHTNTTHTPMPSGLPVASEHGRWREGRATRAQSARECA